MTTLSPNSGAVENAFAAKPPCDLLQAISARAIALPRSIALARFHAASLVPIETISYSELWNRAASLAERLQTQTSIGDVVFLQAADSVEHITWFLAALSAGLHFYPFDPAMPDAAIERVVRHCSPVLAITSYERAPLDHLPRLDSHLARTCSVAAAPPQIEHGCRGGIILQSSGTTGTPKLVVRTTASLAADAFQTALALSLTPQDRIAAVVPLCHSYGTDLIVAGLYSGASLCVLDVFDAASLAGLIANHVTIFPGIPFMFESLLRLQPVPAHPWPLRLAFSAGAPLPMQIQAAMQSRWNVTVGQLYGMTELGAVTFNHPCSPNFDPSSVGSAMHSVELRILDPEDMSRVLPAGAQGHIAVRAPSMLAHYLPCKIPQLADGFFPTGDLGKLDSRGLLYITGRLKLMIDIGGRKVNPLEIEIALQTHPLVAQCAVIAVQASPTVTRLHALVVAKDSTNPPRDADLRRHLKTSLAPYKIPRAFEVVSSLPRSPTGKLLRSLLSPGVAEP